MPSNDHPRDLAAIAIEKILHNLETEGYGKVVRWEEDADIFVRFNTRQACGESYDIALVRLAGALMSDARIGPLFMKRFREVYRFDDEKRPG